MSSKPLETGLDELPRELLLELFLYLPNLTLFNVILCKKEFYEIFKKQNFWRMKFNLKGKKEKYFNPGNKTKNWKKKYFEKYYAINRKSNRFMCCTVTRENPKEKKYYDYMLESNRGCSTAVFGKYDKGKYFFEGLLVEKGCGLGLGIGKSNIQNSDVEYQSSYYGLYHGGYSKNFVIGGKRVKRDNQTTHLEKGDNFGVMFDLDKGKITGYFMTMRDSYDKIKNKKKTTCISRKNFCSHNLPLFEIIKETENNIEKERTERIVYHCVIWFYEYGAKINFNTPKKVTKEFLDSFL